MAQALEQVAAGTAEGAGRTRQGSVHSARMIFPRVNYYRDLDKVHGEGIVPVVAVVGESVLSGTAALVMLVWHFEQPMVRDLLLFPPQQTVSVRLLAALVQAWPERREASGYSAELG